MIDTATMMATIPFFKLIDTKADKFFDDIKTSQKEPKTLQDLTIINDDLMKLIREIVDDLNKEEKIQQQAKTIVQSRFILDIFKEVSDKYNLNFESIFDYLEPDARKLFKKASQNIIH